jgi:hypothetical protein
MGGLHSEVDDGTTDVLLECASSIRSRSAPRARRSACRPTPRTASSGASTPRGCGRARALRRGSSSRRRRRARRAGPRLRPRASRPPGGAAPPGAHRAAARRPFEAARVRALLEPSRLRGGGRAGRDARGAGARLPELRRDARGRPHRGGGAHPRLRRLPGRARALPPGTVPDHPLFRSRTSSAARSSRAVSSRRTRRPSRRPGRATWRCRTRSRPPSRSCGGRSRPRCCGASSTTWRAATATCGSSRSAPRSARRARGAAHRGDPPRDAVLTGLRRRRTGRTAGAVRRSGT